jgi:hypothetical protein
MDLRAGNPTGYLGSDAVIDAIHPDVSATVLTLRGEHTEDAEFSAAAFAYVRDEIAHRGTPRILA